MVSPVLSLLLHPLVCLAFVLWGYVAPSWGEGGRTSFTHLLTKLGFEDPDFPELADASAMAKMAVPAREAKKLDVAQVAAIAKMAGKLKKHVQTNDILTRTPNTPLKAKFVGTPEDESAKVAHPPRSIVDDEDFWCQYDGHDTVNQLKDHVGKWRHGSVFLKMHYVCETLTDVEEKCRPDWHKFKGSCYFAELEELESFEGAHQECSDSNSHLVSIETEAENQFVQDLVGRDSVWIGLDNMKGNWTWTDGTSVNYTNWDDAQPQYLLPKEGVFMNYWKAVCMPPPWLAGLGARMMMLGGIVLVLSCLLLLAVCFAPCVFACMYKKRVSDRRQPLPALPTPGVFTQQDFRFSFCDCFSDMSICCHTFWCPMARAADTHQAAGSDKFWNVVVYWIGSSLVGFVIGGDGLGKCIASVVLALVMTGKRQELRAKLGISPGENCKDFMLWWCCSPCAVAQEAREIDVATGVKVRCCFNLLSSGLPRSLELDSMVGPAVSAAPAAREPTTWGSYAEPFSASPQVVDIALPAAAPAAAAPQPMVATIIHIQPPAPAGSAPAAMYAPPQQPSPTQWH